MHASQTSNSVPCSTHTLVITIHSTTHVSCTGTLAPQLPSRTQHTPSLPTHNLAHTAPHRVIHSLHGRQVAVKVPKLHTTADLARFRVEIATLARLAHCPGVVQLRGARCLPPSYCLVMDLGGPSLASLIYDSTPAWRPAWDQLLSLGVQLARALAAVHEAGIVHRWGACMCVHVRGCFVGDKLPAVCLGSKIHACLPCVHAHVLCLHVPPCTPVLCCAVLWCRDIKPRNILVTTNPVRAQLCDFGVAVCPEVERALGLHDDDPACGGAGGKAAQGSTLGGGVKRAGPTGGFKKHLMVGGGCAWVGGEGGMGVECGAPRV